MSKMAKGTKRVQLRAVQVKVVLKALKNSRSDGTYTSKEYKQAGIVILKLRK